MSRKPDYRVGALNKNTDERATIGAAWLNDDGTIAIQVNDFVHIPNFHGVLITLFPKDYKAKKDEE